MSLHGGPLNGGGGVGGGFTPSPGTPIINGATGGRILERVHSVSYHATNHKLILDVETDQTVGSVKSGNVGNITIQNTGGTPAFAILAYKLWTGADTTDADTVSTSNISL